MTDGRQAVAGVFDRASDTYDGVGVEFFTLVGGQLVEDVGVPDGARVLDVGCGRGAALFAAARTAGSVLGIDLAPGMVERTAADAADRGVTNVAVEVQDAQERRLAGAAFDVVLSSLTVFFLPDPLAGLRAWRAATRPGGRLGITTFVGRDDPRWRWLGQLFPDRDPQETQPGQEEKRSPFSSDDRLHALLDEAGFAEPSSRTREHLVRFADSQQWLSWSWSHGMRTFWERTPEPDRPALERRAFAELARMAGEPEGLTLRMTVRYTTARVPLSG